MTIDLTTIYGMHEVKLTVLFHCPYCERAVRSNQQLRYPPRVVGAFAPVFRCACGKHFGAPVRQEEQNDIP